MLLADYRAYVNTQEAVGNLFLNPNEWARKAILNTARMGKFSSDRSVMTYAKKIWNIEPLTN
jgi:starch phosphorylase